MFVSLDDAILCAQRSQPVAIPTETVWGLAANIQDEKAIRKIFELKGRPSTNPLIIHVSAVEEVQEYVKVFPDEASYLIEKFWPGGLTLVLPVYEERVRTSIRAGLTTAAFRMPKNSATLDLLRAVGPMVAPSANISGSPSATLPAHIESDFGKDFPILASHTCCEHGLESTILIWKERRWYIGRYGAIDQAELENALGTSLSSLHSDKPLCPGQHFKHYSPNAHLTLQSRPWCVQDASHFDTVLGFTDREYIGANKIVTMGSSDNTHSIAARLYAALRELDEVGAQQAFVDLDVTGQSTWTAILDRLKRAAEESSL